jgi:hypothetical protein
MILSFDPGLRKAGCALWDFDGNLVRAWTVRQRNRKLTDLPAWTRLVGQIKLESPVKVLVSEMAQIYARNRRTNPEGLLQITGVIGALAWRFRDAELYCYRPREWKGQIPKGVMQARLESALSREELGRVEKGATHDTWDAIGIGVFHLRKWGIGKWDERGLFSSKLLERGR